MSKTFFRVVLGFDFTIPKFHQVSDLVQSNSLISGIRCTQLIGVKFANHYLFTLLMQLVSAVSTEVIMFELKISALQDALQLSQNWATHTISLLNPGIENYGFTIPVANQDGNLRRYYFYDITSESETDESIAVLASPQQIQDILAFTAPLKSIDKLLVHCHAGVSRSTAVACAVLCQHGLTPNQAVKHLLSIRPYAHPNKQVLTLFDEILGLKGELVVAGTEEIVRLNKKRLTSLFRK